METMKIKDLKKLLSDLEQERGNIDELEIWIQPFLDWIQPTERPSLEFHGMGILDVSNNVEPYRKEVFGVYLKGCF